MTSVWEEAGGRGKKRRRISTRMSVKGNNRTAELGDNVGTEQPVRSRDEGEDKYGDNTPVVRHKAHEGTWIWVR